ncbi:MAG: GlsB/YeaQ/YmgE family stress response membrane protein [Veillonellaceae bacterium]|mgnify:CR=1 FL=1|jgi:uncharacterized membrane protein YeaQ/YmgE (transglycosylase-associated protein family)|nr:GlsB/YeaQ/YmgE family stress response membrane protein [Veillonellaceae bacterium]
MFWSVIVGLAAGWIAARMSRGENSIFWGNITIGLMGSLVGGFLVRMYVTGWPGTLLGIVASIIGAAVALFILKMIAHKNKGRY